MGIPCLRLPHRYSQCVVTPQIRSRFLKMEPGQSAQRHSHDLGHEIFLILEGRVEFEIDGEIEALGPGQMWYRFGRSTALGTCPRRMNR